MPNHQNIYKNEAETYHRLISKQPDLLPVIRSIKLIDGLDIVEIGAGTGRLTAVMAPYAKSIVALDASEAMLQVNAARLKDTGLTNWTVLPSDNRKLPLADNCADLVAAGWTICYSVSENVPDWKENLDTILSEIRRVLRPGGTVLLFETMGTGTETPAPPSFLTAYYAALTEQFGFSHTWIRTDYEFDTVEQAEELTRFFFGDELGDKVARHGMRRLQECAGVWWLHL